MRLTVALVILAGASIDVSRTLYIETLRHGALNKWPKIG